MQKLSDMPALKLHGLQLADAAKRTPTFALTCTDCTPQSMAKMLGEQNVCVWNGHFYALGLVRQLGLESSGGVLRIGLMHYNTTEEIDHLFALLRDGLPQLA
ncbi:NifS-like protein [Vibrio cholerae]|nr:NifS-like protein [Vibrio cholerae]CSI86695.1 NifS-like protein [Vibrio cholerae]